MKRQTHIIAAVTVLLILATRESARAADRWEYATLVATGTLTWRTGDRIVTATTVQQFPAFYKELTGQAWSGKADLGDQTVAMLLDAVGAQGWELVQVHTENNGPRVYYFKRRAS